jgi:hypothetical protein
MNKGESMPNWNMEKEHNALFEKMARLIDTAKPEHKSVVERYISLCNRKLHNDLEKHKLSKPQVWGLIGGSLGIESRFNGVFGVFNRRSEPIYIEVGEDS